MAVAAGPLPRVNAGFTQYHIQLDPAFNENRRGAQKYFPGITYCKRCGKAWEGVQVTRKFRLFGGKPAKHYTCKPHVVYPKGSHVGSFALCEPCWDLLGDISNTPFHAGSQRVAFYAQCFNHYPEWPDIKLKILQDSGFDPIPPKKVKEEVLELPDKLPENFLATVLEDLRDIDRELPTSRLC